MPEHLDRIMHKNKFPPFERLTFRIHALQQMFRRHITETDIRELIDLGVIIEDYPDDTPYPSCLVSGIANNRPLHVVLAYNKVDHEAIVITAYEPDPSMWTDTFTRRKP